ncbi:MAG: 5-formyltetrahydrofolate cyclo-ligase, partial [Armatimonadetes bacterium]|nr:5-formyltetrahydrofolate cyclo-ligase [Armatimonadota bacterium]NIM23497.1 5-formyltetrahydrofolate cyclo-ligase [Armatimonadota bacterium]NIM67363.1 5-formyltetrahydrofolate cyclo-ligase [Armatimonadota bacterium]NIM75864.1 5-formyltetrahydrofolate cyclo-ligase [Armatimonadota bacterium]NIN05549.1 5-formyltetrahydrofolate cyclo-ligase [Armatimonadota bacterium]
SLADQLYAQQSYRVAQKLIRQPEFMRAQMVGIFVGYGGEVETVRLMEAALKLGKRVAAPTINRNERRLLWREVEEPDEQIDLGPLGLPEPLPSCHEAEPGTFDLVTVPGLVWDEQGRRLTRWGGYFERFLNTVPRVFKVGLAFELQVVEDLSKWVESTLVDALITDDQVRRFGLLDTMQPERRLPGGPDGYKG